jgi:hypothetical protein
MLGIDLLVIVEYYGCTVGKNPEQFSEEATRETRYVVLILRGE